MPQRHTVPFKMRSRVRVGDEEEIFELLEDGSLKRTYRKGKQEPQVEIIKSQIGIEDEKTSNVLTLFAFLIIAFIAAMLLWPEFRNAIMELLR